MKGILDDYMNIFLVCQPEHVNMVDKNRDRHHPPLTADAGIDIWRSFRSPPFLLRFCYPFYDMMIGSKGPCDALAQSHETLFDPPNTHAVFLFLR